MKEYTLVFCFNKTLELMFLRTMPDGGNAGKLNGLGGRIADTASSIEEQLSVFFDTEDSKFIHRESVMTVDLMNGCTPGSDTDPIRLHVVGLVFDHLKSDYKREKAYQIKHCATYDALCGSAEDLSDNIALRHPYYKYVSGFHYFLKETLGTLHSKGF